MLKNYIKEELFADIKQKEIVLLKWSKLMIRQNFSTETS